jgi:dsRNA-specific ribonuclease
MDNPNNVLITKNEVENILNYFGNIGDLDENGNSIRLLIKNLDFYQRAFVHESYYQSVLNFINENQNNQNPNNQENSKKIYVNYMPTSSNEILEYLGDHILKASLGRYLYQRFGTEREGFLTRLKIKIEKCSMLHQIAVTLGFKRYLLLSLQIENQTLLDQDRGRQTPSYYEDAFESFLGAMMEDFGEQGYIYAERFIRNIIDNVLDFGELINTNDNHKDSLQRFFQGFKWRTPTYISLHEEGPLYRKVFTRILYITQEQFNELNNEQQKNLKKYNQDCLNHYKTKYPEVFLNIFNETSKNNNVVLCIGKGRKVVDAEQMAAKQGLLNLNLDDNY